MAKWKNKVTNFEAVQVRDIVSLVSGSWMALPDWVKTQYDKGAILFGSSYVIIGGSGSAGLQDWIVQDADGNLTVETNADFVKKYEVDNGPI